MTSALQRPARLDVGVVGTGRVGAVLGAALARAGHRVVAASAVSAASLERARRLLPGVPICGVPGVVARSELVLLTVPDDALPGLADGLSATGGWQAGQLVVHTSGRYGTEVLRSAIAAHALPLALHPAMTFSGTASDLQRLSECCFGVSALPSLRLVAEALVVEMGAEPVWIRERDRVAYHAALAHGSNHLVTLVAQAEAVLRACGVSEPERVLRPLLAATLDNALRGGDAALTGPVSRGDAGTVAVHLEALGQQSADIRPAYLAMARATTQRAERAGRLDASAAHAVLQALGDQADRP